MGANAHPRPPERLPSHEHLNVSPAPSVPGGTEALSAEAFDGAKAASAGERRVASAAKLRDAVVRALQQIHAMLDPEQRARLAYLIRTGTLAV